MTQADSRYTQQLITYFPGMVQEQIDGDQARSTRLAVHLSWLRLADPDSGITS